MLTINPQIQIPLREISFTFSRSSGPGGQNVNKVNTKATLRWQVSKTAALPPDVKERFEKKYRRRITTDGELVLHSQRFRDQGRNVADSLEKLRNLVLEVAAAPVPRKRRRPSRTAKEKRLKEKRLLSEKKNRRRPINRDD